MQILIWTESWKTQVGNIEKDNGEDKILASQTK